MRDPSEAGRIVAMNLADGSRLPIPRPIARRRARRPDVRFSLEEGR
ncbi:MAG TPA: hypothetical protein VOA00_12675 [Thermoanaerobaculia bacterium]|nr:hypothetical protein [Thermoanaerobaculia bacterium]